MSESISTFFKKLRNVELVCVSCHQINLLENLIHGNGRRFEWWNCPNCNVHVLLEMV